MIEKKRNAVECIDLRMNLKTNSPIRKHANKNV